MTNIYNPIQSEDEFKAVSRANLDSFRRLIDYHIQELDSGWRNLSRRDSDIRKHQLEFLEELLTRVENAAQGTLSKSIRF